MKILFLLMTIVLTILLATGCDTETELAPETGPVPEHFVEVPDTEAAWESSYLEEVSAHTSYTGVEQYQIACFFSGPGIFFRAKKISTPTPEIRIVGYSATCEPLREDKTTLSLHCSEKDYIWIDYFPLAYWNHFDLILNKYPREEGSLGELSWLVIDSGTGNNFWCLRSFRIDSLEVEYIQR